MSYFLELIQHIIICVITCFVVHLIIHKVQDRKKSKPIKEDILSRRFFTFYTNNFPLDKSLSDNRILEISDFCFNYNFDENTLYLKEEIFNSLIKEKIKRNLYKEIIDE